MYKVYRGINHTKKEVYFGVAKDVKARRDGNHCRGGTKALKHWNCEKDRIVWKEISNHYKQERASQTAHALEKNYKHPQRFKNIQTSGI